MSQLNTNIRGEQIRDNSVDESKLKVYNTPTDGYFLSWDSTQGQFKWVSTTGAEAVSEAPSGAIDGVNTTFTLSSSPLSNSLSVYLNGLYQEEGAGKDYTLSGTTITFNTAPESGSILLVHYLRALTVGGDARTYRKSFTNSDLTSGVLSVTHNLGQKYVQCQVFDNNDKLITPDDITLVDTSSLNIDLTSFGTLTGTWNVIIIG